MRGSQLERQGEPVEALTNLGDIRRIVVVDDEAGANGGPPLRE